MLVIFDELKMTIMDHFIQFKPILDHFRPFQMGTLEKMTGNYKTLAKALLGTLFLKGCLSLFKGICNSSGSVVCNEAIHINVFPTC